MNTSEVLNRAADLIEERGWITGKGWTDDGSGPLCAEGAIAAVMGRPDGIGFRCAAYDAVREYVGDKPLFLWNDHALWQDNHWRNPLRVPGDMEASHDEARVYVVATLRAVALIEAAKENTSIRESVSA